jgi:hypothetical protein
MSSLSNVSSNLLQSLIAAGLGSTTSTQRTDESTNTLDSSGVSSLSSSTDSAQISPFSQLLSTLQKLQQSDPSEYKSVMTQIGDKLADAAKAATADGDSAGADQLTKLSDAFKSAGESGDLPDIGVLAQSLDGPRGAPPPPPPPSSDSSSTTDDSDTTTDSSTSTSTSTSSTDSTELSDELTAKILEAFGLGSTDSSNTQAQSFQAMSIIMDTLADAGVLGSSAKTS